MRLCFALSIRLLTALATVGTASALAADPAPAAETREVIAVYFAMVETEGGNELAGETLTATGALARFYAGRDHAPAWTDPGRSRELLAILGAAGAHGLNPEDYLVATLRDRLLQNPEQPAEVAELDLLLSEAFLRYFSHLARGKVDTARLDPADDIAQASYAPSDLAAVLSQALAAPTLAGFLEHGLPSAPLYDALVAALAEYRALASTGGWPDVGPGPSLHPGDHEPRVAELRARLSASADIPGGDAPDPQLFDAAMAAAVERFQLRHQLQVDGIVGPETLAALNVPIDDRIDQLRLSLERLRWVRGVVPTRFVAVNIAGFSAFLIHDGRAVWSARVMVGRHYRQTPVFRGKIVSLEVNPSWTLPPTILIEDVLPEVRKNPAYLAERHMRVLDLEGRELDETTIDWNSYEDHFPYLIRQSPGPWNALGTLKFVIPNAYSVFIHDTPQRNLFARPQRSFSAGCIRVENPEELAVRLLDDPDRYGPEQLRSFIASGKTRRIMLDEPVPVLVLYLTASVRDNGLVHFFPDIYDRDPNVLAALDAPFPARPVPGQ